MGSESEKVLSGGGDPKGGGAHFIQHAIKHPGALHKELGVPVGQPIPQEKLERAAKAKGEVGRRARFAQVLEGLRHGKRHEAAGEFEG